LRVEPFRVDSDIPCARVEANLGLRCVTTSR
jgi:hypothetical protein